MTETNKTLIYAGVAVVLALLAFLLSPSPPSIDEFSDQGAPFFPDFTDPNAARTLEVIEYNEQTGSPSAFKVTFEDGRWVIPSHHKYPADAGEHLAQTAAGVIDISRDDFRTANAADYEELGVIDPLDETAGLTGRGRRVTIKGSGGEVLADLIFGRPIPQREGFRFVRHPDEKRVYAARVQIEISTNFTDWIDQDLLKVNKSALERVEVNDYSIDERTRRVNRRDHVVLEKSGGNWTIPGLPETQEVDSATMATMLTTIDSLAIVGVRPKPQGLSASLKAEGAETPIAQADARSLASKGFFMTRDGQLMSNEGELILRTNQGVVYTLRFGEVVYGSGTAVTAGTDETATGDQQSAQNQYLFVTAEFNEDMFPEPPQAVDLSFQTKPDSLLTEEDKENRRIHNEWQSWNRKVTKGRDKVQELNDRFADWYYVISHDSFTKLHKNRGDLVVAKKDE